MLNGHPNVIQVIKYKRHTLFLICSINTTGAAKKRLIHWRITATARPDHPVSSKLGTVNVFLSVGKFQRCTGSHVVVVWVRGTVMRLWRKREEIAKASCTTVLLYHFQVDTGPVRTQTRPLQLVLCRGAAWWCNSTAQRLQEQLHLFRVRLAYTAQLSAADEAANEPQ